MKKKFFLIIGLVLILLIGVGIWWLNSDQYTAKTDFSKDYYETDKYYYYDNPQSEKAIIFYTGGKVEPLAYSYLNQTGYDIYLPKFKFNLAIFNPNIAANIIEENDQAEWYIGGHSLGGVMAYQFAENHPELINGVISLAGYPQQKIDSSDYSILAIFGCNDGLLPDYLEKGNKLPTDATKVIIKGGNHAQFGEYGSQKGDNQAKISGEIQREKTVKQIKDFID